MTVRKSTKSGKAAKPDTLSPNFGTEAKPERPKNFPLFAHNNGQWAKKVLGRLHYFGVWADPDAALNRWLAERDYHLAGRRPPLVTDADQLTVGRLCDLFLDSRSRRVDSGEIAAKTFADYKIEAKLLVSFFGRGIVVDSLTPSDFGKLRAKLAKSLGIKTLHSRIGRIRAILNFADKNGYLDVPLAKIIGTEFQKPSATAINKAAAKVSRVFTAQEVWRLVDAAPLQLKAMILLGLNGGIGNTDLGRLEFAHIELEAGWLVQSRQKTGVGRKIPLWPETVAALRAAVAKRREPIDPAHSDRVFITLFRGTWEPTPGDDPITKEFSKLRKELGITAKGKSFYSLRHTFQTVGDGIRDFVAVSAIMGHARRDISDNYRHGVTEERLQAVVEHVRQWFLKGKPETPPT